MNGSTWRKSTKICHACGEPCFSVAAISNTGVCTSSHTGRSNVITDLMITLWEFQLLARFNRSISNTKYFVINILEAFAFLSALSMLSFIQRQRDVIRDSGHFSWPKLYLHIQLVLRGEHTAFRLLNQSANFVYINNRSEISTKQSNNLCRKEC